MHFVTFTAEVALKSKSSKSKAAYVRVQLLEFGMTGNYINREYKERCKSNENEFLYYCPMATINGKNVAFLIYPQASNDSNEERLKVFSTLKKFILI